MALGYAFTYTLIVLTVSPLLWVTWWLVAEAGRPHPIAVARRDGRIARTR